MLQYSVTNILLKYFNRHIKNNEIVAESAKTVKRIKESPTNQQGKHNRGGAEGAGSTGNSKGL